LAGGSGNEARKRGWRHKLAVVAGVVAYALLHAPSSTEPAIANGDTRSLTLVNNHTNESGTFTYRVDGAYDSDALDKLNWFLRDWRLNEQTKMDPKLFDILWDAYRQSGSSQPIDILSAYRSPQTNAMLRRRSRLVAEHSQHMQGKAVDAHFIDVSVASARDVAMRMQEGGVGYYPIGNTPWVHIDSGAVRYWPRMSRSALARLFPDGKTVFIPSDGQPMDGYAEAKAMIESRGGDVQTASNSGGLFGWLFGGARGGGADDEEESAGARVIAGGRGGPQVVMGGGRGGPAAVAADAEPPAAAPAPAPAPIPEPAAPPPAPAEAVAVADPAAEAPQAAEASDAEAAVDAPAPLPPRKPVGLVADLDPVAPVPPKRPAEWAIGPTGSKGSASNGDLIATLIEHNALPSAISQGVHAAPKAALALVDQHSGAVDPDALTRAATLAMPPLPPPRPRTEPQTTVTKIEKSPPPPPHPAKTTRPSAANPYGSLVVDAFSAPPAPAGASPVGLRGVAEAR
jgi:uncharacterized protein YcbK (DUF882 family)